MCLEQQIKSKCPKQPGDLLLTGEQFHYRTFSCYRAVFSNFGDRLLDSPVVLSVIVGLFIAYALLLLWARRADRADRIKVQFF